MAAVSAGDVNETTDPLTTDDNMEELSVEDSASLSEAENQSDIVEAKDTSSSIKASAKVSSQNVMVKNSNFTIRILDDNGKGISGVPVEVKFNNNVSNITTDAKGYAHYKLTSKGTYTLSYTFKHDGYTTVKGSKSITVVGNSVSKFSGSNYVAYVGVKNPYTVTLTAGGVSMPNQKVVFKINGKTYTVKTNSKGVATLNINLAKGSYKIKYTFKGVKNANAVSKTSKITVKKGMPTKIVRMNSVVYRHQTSAPLIFKYKDARGNAIPSKTIVLKIGSKTYIKKTNKSGMVSFSIKQSKGIYKVTANSYYTDVYIKSTNSFSLKVKSKSVRLNGFWLFGADMKKVNLTTMAKNGINQIFLNEYAVTLHGKEGVSQFACEARSLGIKVHIWMQTFYDGDWISPVTSSGKYKYSLFNSIIKDAKEYAAIEGVAGIHFDYLRFPGTAYKHTNGAKAINYFVKTACNALHKQNSALIVSAALMAEPGAMKYYYGQDVPTISKYLDWIVPMVYKGNYNQNSAWIKSVTNYFVQQSQGALVLTGLQGYGSDTSVKKLSASSLMNDADYAGLGGARGVIVFRYTLFNMINFNNV